MAEVKKGKLVQAEPGRTCHASTSVRSKSELKKVVWPTYKQVLNNTLIVVALRDLSWAFSSGCLTLLARLAIDALIIACPGLRVAVMAETAKWYVVHTYSGYENTVKATIEKTVETRELAGPDPWRVHSPGNRHRRSRRPAPARRYDRKVFPGYVLVKMVMTRRDLACHPECPRRHRLCRRSGNKPTPLTDEEVDALGRGKAGGRG